MKIFINLVLLIIALSPVLVGVLHGWKAALKTALNLFLVAVSIFLYVVVLLVSMPYTIIKLWVKGDLNKLSKYYFDTALGNDMSGGVLGQHVFNDWWVKPHGVRFGQFGISISKLLAENKKKGTWYQFGAKFGQFLNWLDDGHLEDSKL